MVIVDQLVRFDAFENISVGVEKISYFVIGTVYAVNYENKVFHVVYTMGATELRTSFKFCDIGTKVHLCK